MLSHVVYFELFDKYGCIMYILDPVGPWDSGRYRLGESKRGIVRGRSGGKRGRSCAGDGR